MMWVTLTQFWLVNVLCTMSVDRWRAGGAGRSRSSEVTHGQEV